MGYECKKAPNYNMEAPHKLYPQQGEEIPVIQYEMEEPYRLRESHYREGPLGKISLEDWPLGYLIHDTSIRFSDVSALCPSTPGIRRHARGGL